MKDLTLQIDGMKCEGCASRVHAALSGVAGVRRADVSLEESEARIVGDDTLEESELVAAVEGAGYEAQRPA